MRESYWKIGEGEEYPSLSGDIKCGCLIIGGGLCGVLTAYLLGKRGIDTVLIEKECLGHGKTLGTTAKATVCHGLTYLHIRGNHGIEGVAQYAEANLAGLRLLREILLEDDMAEECEARSADFILYSLHGERKISEEYEALLDAGIECTTFKGENDLFELPFAPKSGILLPDQLSFHPIRAVRAIAKRSNVRIYEGTEAESIRSTANSHVIKTTDGHAICASKVISAANYPVLMPRSLSFLKLYRETSYAAAFDGAPTLSRMYYGIDGGYAYRSHGNHLIVSGERHRSSPVPNAAVRLGEQAASLFGGVNEIASWSNNDSYTHDGIPYVGEAGAGLFLAAGFGGWGMTNSAAAALILSYLAAGESPRFGGIFSPSRNILKGGGESFLHHVGISAAGMAKRFTVPELTADKLLPGCAGVVTYNGGRAGAYRDEEGRLHFVSLKCPHLGCSLEWNGAARTWDCPCHGSRFSYDGVCISEPSQKGISL